MHEANWIFLKTYCFSTVGNTAVLKQEETETYFKLKDTCTLKEKEWKNIALMDLEDFIYTEWNKLDKDK